MFESKNLLTEWVNKYTDSLYNWALLKVNKPAIAEDLVQDTFLAAYKSIDKFQSKSQPKTWLLSILKNKIADHYRKQFKMQTVNESDIGGAETGGILDKVFNKDGKWNKEMRPGNWENDEAELLDNHDFLRILKLCMELLNEKSFLAIQYKFLEEKEGKIICQELGITPTNFWQILHRAKLQLRGCIDEKWFKH